MAIEHKAGTTIRDLWASYERVVVHPDAGPRQREATRDAFYAGAVTVFSAVAARLGNGRTSAADIAADRAFMLGLHEESEAYLAECAAKAVMVMSGGFRDED